MKIDIFLTQLINSYSNKSYLFDKVVILFTKYWLVIIVFTIILFWWTKNNRIEKRKEAIFCWLVTIIWIITNQIIILFINRIRPYESWITNLIIDKSTDPSFPSDHSTVAFSVAFALLYKNNKNASIYIYIAILMWLSRVYVWTHYFSDVLWWIIVAFIATKISKIIEWRISFIINQLIKIL